jgi:hypothetical protein
MIDPNSLKPGDVLSRLWDTGAMGMTTLHAEVVRVNRLTVTLRNLDAREPDRRVSKGFIIDNYQRVTK